MKRARDKLENKLANAFIRAIRQDYDFVPRVETAIGIARMMIHEYKQHVELGSSLDVKEPLEMAYENYYSTTKLPEKEKRDHSASFFKNFLHAHYTTILLPRGSRHDKAYRFYKKLRGKIKK